MLTTRQSAIDSAAAARFAAWWEGERSRATVWAALRTTTTTTIMMRGERLRAMELGSGSLLVGPRPLINDTLSLFAGRRAELTTMIVFKFAVCDVLTVTMCRYEAVTGEWLSTGASLCRVEVLQRTLEIDEENLS
jgi:hypothetical protein